MDISRSLPRKRWTLLTAILATLAVIAALLTVPLNNASAAEPKDFKPNTTLGSDYKKELKSREETGEDESYIAADYNWGVLVWAGAPVGEGTGTGPNENNDVGWAWCVAPLAHTPLETKKAYQKATATRLKFDNQYHDAVINLARKMESAAARGDEESAAKAANYYVYLLAFLNMGSKNQTDVVTKKAVIGTIRNNEDQYQVSNRTGKRVKVFPKFSGSLDEFTELTGYRIEGEADGGTSGPWSGKPLTFVKDPSVKVEKQPADAFITVVHPNGSEDKSLQTVMPVDQPGLPDEDGGSGSNPSTMTPKISTKVDQLDEHEALKKDTVVTDHVHYEGLVPGKEYVLNAELRNKADESVIGKSNPDEPVKFTPESASGDVDVKIIVNDDVKAGSVKQGVAYEYLTSTAVDASGKDSESGKDNEIAKHTDINDKAQTVDSHDELTPSISTKVDQLDEHEALKKDTVVTDHVHYEGLVPGKEYTLKAELISKKDGKTVLGKGEATFTPKKSKGMEPVTITVNDDVTEPVEAAVAFEELTSTEVNDKGEDTPDTTPDYPNHIAEHKDINDKDQTVTSHKKGGKTPWWLILIPGIGLGKIIKDHFDHKDHGNHNGGHGDNNHQPGNQDAPEGGNSGHGNGNGDAPGQEPEEVGNALPSDAQRVDIKSVPSGATELEPGMQSYVK